MLTQEALKLKIHYDPDTGIFTRELYGKTKVTGSDNGMGYLQICIDKKKYKAHRLAWLYMYGEWPKNVIDHINGNPSDNRICNLRDVTTSENLQNCRKASKGSKSGLLGVCWDKARRKWEASIRHNGKLKKLGCYSDKFEAYEKYLEAKRILHPTCTL